MRSWNFLLLLVFLFGLKGPFFDAHAQSLQAHGMVVHFVPPESAKTRWPFVTSRKLEKVTESVERKLEWDLRRISVYFYNPGASFSGTDGIARDSRVLAYTRKVGSEISVHMGPALGSENWERIFAHELTHVILAQKYKDSVPRWLEEGLANWIGKAPRPAYGELRNRSLPPVRSLSHPFSAAAELPVPLHYAYSQASADFLNSKCGGLLEIVTFAAGKKLESFLSTTCGIQDLDRELKEWIEARAAK